MSDKCHMPRCPHPRVSETLCAWHAKALLGRPVQEQDETERKKAA